MRSMMELGCVGIQTNIFCIFNLLGCFEIIDAGRFSRSGLSVDLLPEYYNSFPKDIYVDAEAWFGRGSFSNSISLVTGAADLICWDLMR